MKPDTYTFTSESACERQPDKVCDYIADRIPGAHLAQDSHSRVACEVLCPSGTVVPASEITSKAIVAHEPIAGEVIREVGYTGDDGELLADIVEVRQLITGQADEIARGVEAGRNFARKRGAGDQGLADDRHSRRRPWLRPDRKSRVSVLHESGQPRFVADDLGPRELRAWTDPGIEFPVNPTGSFVQGGPMADCGVRGRKISVDSYGGAVRHSGGAFTGKGPSKLMRSGAYLSRYVARQVVGLGLARMRRDSQRPKYPGSIGLGREGDQRTDGDSMPGRRACRIRFTMLEGGPRYSFPEHVENGHLCWKLRRLGCGEEQRTGRMICLKDIAGR